MKKFLFLIALTQTNCMFRSFLRRKAFTLLVLLNINILPATAQKLIPYREGKLWGYCDKSRKVIIPLQFDFCKPFSGAYAAVRKNNVFGLIDTSGKIAVPLQFQDISYIGGLHFMVQLNNAWGIINTKGEVVLPMKYREFWFREGIARICEASSFYGSYNFIDSTGKPITSRTFSAASDFSDGVAAVQPYNGRWCYIDKWGNELLCGDFRFAGDFKEGYAPVNRNDSSGFIDKAGNEAYPFRPDKYQVCSSFGNGVFITVGGMSRSYYGYRYNPKTKSERQIFGPLNGTCYGFENGVSIVHYSEGKVGIIDTTGKEVLPAVYSGITRQSNGLFKVVKNGKAGFVDQKFQEVIPVTLDAAGDFDEDNLALVKREGMEGYIDKKGIAYFRDKYTMPFPFTYDMTGPFRNGRAFAGKKNGNNVYYAIIDTNGSLITDFKFFYIDVSPEYSDYDIAPQFKKGFCALKKSAYSKYAIVNINGKEITDYIFDNIRDLYAGEFAQVWMNNRVGVIDTTGKFIISCKYDSAMPIASRVMAVYSKSNKFWQFVNLKDSIITKQVFSSVLWYGEDAVLFCVKDTSTKRWGYINNKGVYVIKPTFEEAGNFYSGMAAVKNQQGLWGYIDKTGKLVIPYKYTRDVLHDYDRFFNFDKGVSNISKFSTGRLFTEQEFALVDKTGKQILPFEKVMPYDIVANNVAHNGSKKQFFNQKGAVIYDYSKESFYADFQSWDEEMVNGHFRIKTNYDAKSKQTCGLMNNKWQIVVEPGIFQTLGILSEGFVVAKKDGKWGYLKVAK